MLLNVAYRSIMVTVINAMFGGNGMFEFDYKKYEKDCDNIRATNKTLLNLFENDLADAGLSRKTINRHLANVDFYINDYLLLEEAHPMEDGVGMVYLFLGNFFIRKCMWSTPATIKSTATSIKKFYKCMLDHGKIKKNEYDYLCADIKDGMPQWQADCEQFNDPYSENPFDFF